MNVERSIEHLLKLHARAEARLDRTDRQIEAIRKIVKVGMKLIVRIEAAQVRTDAKVEKLAEMWLKRPPNGNTRR